MAIMIAVIAIGAAFAEHRAPVLREALKWVEYAAAIAAVFAAYRLDPDDSLVLNAWTFSIAAVCASALIEEVFGAPSGLWISPGVVPRIAGVLEGPNQLAGYLETAIAVLASWSIFQSRRRVQTLSEHRRHNARAYVFPRRMGRMRGGHYCARRHLP